MTARFVVGVVGIFGVAAGLTLARRSRRLGATARKGPRTGAVEVDMAEIRQLVDRAVETFQPCDPDELGTPRPGYVQPGDRIPAGGAIAVHDAATGARQVVPVAFDSRLSTRPLVTGALQTRANPATGWVSQHATVRPSRHACTTKARWHELMVETLSHEIAHATDTGLRKRAVQARRGGTSHNDEASYRAYLNNREEITANLVAVRTEIERRQRADRDLVEMPPTYVLRAYSDRWNSMAPYLTDENKRRFYRMAARLSDEMRARYADNERRAGTGWRKRQLVEHVTRRRRARRKEA